MVQSTKNDRESREKTFDAYYNEQILATQDKMERINIVSEALKNKYEDYKDTTLFIEYLSSVEKVFAQAEKDRWSVEKTQDEMIRGEIYIMSQSTGIDEKIFMDIYMDFKDAKHDVAKVQEVANRLVEKYSNIEDCFECEDCKKFITYVKESLIMFSKTLGGNENFDELEEVKIESIKIKMKLIAVDGRPPIEILQEIFEDFVGALKK